MFESLRSAIIGIGHFCIIVIAAVFAKKPHLFHSLGIWSDALEITKICPVHREYEIEFFEIFGAHPSSLPIHGQSSALSCSGHARIGRVPRMGIERTGGITEYLGKIRLLEPLPHHVFRGGRAANVSPTNEEDRTKFCVWV